MIEIFDGIPSWALILFPMIWIEYIQIAMSYVVDRRQRSLFAMQRIIDGLVADTDAIGNSSETFVEKSKMERQIIRLNKQVADQRSETKRAVRRARWIGLVAINLMQGLLLGALLRYLPVEQRTVMTFPSTPTFKLPSALLAVLALGGERAAEGVAIGVIPFLLLCKATLGGVMSFLRADEDHPQHAGTMAGFRTMARLMKVARAHTETEAEAEEKKDE